VRDLSYQHLVHTPAIHIHDFKAPGANLQAISDRRDTTEPRHQKSAQRLKSAVLFSRQLFDPQGLFELIDG